MGGERRTVFGGMIETIHRDGPQVTLVALVGVIMLVIVMSGLRGAVPVLLSLGMGIVGSAGCSATRISSSTS